MHNPHHAHHELKTVGGVHGSLEGFVTEGKLRRGKAVKKKSGGEKVEDDARQSSAGDIATQESAQDKPVVVEADSREREKANLSANATLFSSPTAVQSKAASTKESNSNELSEKTVAEGTISDHKIINPSDSVHPVAHLSCEDHGGPSDPKIIDEMVFWSDIPTDASYVSPMYEEGNEKYLTFEP